MTGRGGHCGPGKEAGEGTAARALAQVVAPAKGKLKVHAGTPRQLFMSSVERAKAYIAAGDIFQVVLSQRLDFTPSVAPSMCIARCAR